MPKDVRLAEVGPGIAFALAVLRGSSSAEAKNWFDR